MQLQRSDLQRGHDHSDHGFSFDVEETIQDVLAQAARLKQEGAPIAPRFDFYTWAGEKIFSMNCRPFDGEQDLNVALFEGISLINACGACYCVFYYVPRQPDGDPLWLTVMQVDSSRHLGIKTMWSWSDDMSAEKPWIAVDVEKVKGTPDLEDLPLEVWQDLTVSSSHDTAFDFETLYRFLGGLGHSFEFFIDEEPKHIPRAMLYRVQQSVRKNVLDLMEDTSGRADKTEVDISDIEVIE